MDSKVTVAATDIQEVLRAFESNDHGLELVGQQLNQVAGGLADLQGAHAKTIAQLGQTESHLARIQFGHGELLRTLDALDQAVARVEPQLADLGIQIHEALGRVEERSEISVLQRTQTLESQVNRLICSLENVQDCIRTELGEVRSRETKSEQVQSLLLAKVAGYLERMEREHTRIYQHLQLVEAKLQSSSEKSKRAAKIANLGLATILVLVVMIVARI